MALQRKTLWPEFADSSDTDGPSNRQSRVDTFFGAPAGIRTPNQQIMRRFEGHQQGETKRDDRVFTESEAVKVCDIWLYPKT
jgi:hypothetical protein